MLHILEIPGYKPLLLPYRSLIINTVSQNKLNTIKKQEKKCLHRFTKSNPKPGEYSI